MIRLAALFGAFPALAHAAETAAPMLDGGTVLQMLASLALVLGAIVALAWLLRRLGQGPGGNTGLLRVIGSASVGQKERVVVVEVSDVWLVLGVAPGQVAPLYTLPRQEHAAAKTGPAAPPFAMWLQRAMGKHETPAS